MIRELGTAEKFELCETNHTKKYNVLTVFFHGIKDLCIVFADITWFAANPKKFKKLRLDALSIPNYVIKEGLTHGARHGKTEVR